jgi:polyferredoxin
MSPSGSKFKKIESYLALFFLASVQLFFSYYRFRQPEATNLHEFAKIKNSFFLLHFILLSRQILPPSGQAD